ncbi:hypothetical protein [Alteribacter aurantiacus]|uniref:hypothetical protein n=1 Tax=Alteribacter aurantiacus TaxID=254410 RepID=UPI00040DE020|nr:hypothetical protein [Alteribacter aurantiacus]
MKKGVMKTTFGVGVFLGALLLFSACAEGEETEAVEAAKPLVSETEAGDFLLRLVSDQPIYKTAEEVKLTAKLKYIGEKERITLNHSQSPFHYQIEEVTRGIEVPFGRERIQLTTELERDHWYEESFTKPAISLLSEDKDYKFYKSFVESEGFPPGEYEIELNSDFEVLTDGIEGGYLVTTGVIITVIEE